MKQFVLSTLIVAFAVMLSSEAAWSEEISATNPEITPEEVMSHVRYLASDELEGRLSGTDGQRKAADYIAAHFREYGLTPLGKDGSYEQEFEFVSGVEIGEDSALSFVARGKKKDVALRAEFFPINFSGAGDWSGEVAFVGYGISAPKLHYDDYDGIDVKNKAVIALRYTPDGDDKKSPFYEYAPMRRKANTARDKGASAIIFVTPTNIKEPHKLEYLKTGIGATADSRIQAVIMLRAVARSVLGAEGFDLPEIEAGLNEGKSNSFLIPGVKASLSTVIERKISKTSNIAGLLKAQSPKGMPDKIRDKTGETLVIGAHYDHIGYGIGVSRSSALGNSPDAPQIHNGADDNASGVAGVLELAGYFAGKRKELKRDILFIAFSGEELGLLGSTYYVQHPLIPKEDTVAMLNMDMIGRMQDNKLSVLGSGSSTEWNAIIGEANLKVGLQLTLNDSGFAPSDQTAFLAKEIPALHFFTGIHEDYHTPADDWEKINFEGEAKLLLLLVGVVEGIDDMETRIAFDKESLKNGGKSFARFNVYLGTIPDYSQSGRGVKLLGVKPGGPAEKAGIKADDTIVGFSGKEINDIYDYTYALTDAEADIPVEIKVIRENKEITLEVIPQRRESD